MIPDMTVCWGPISVSSLSDSPSSSKLASTSAGLSVRGGGCGDTPWMYMWKYCASFYGCMYVNVYQYTLKCATTCKLKCSRTQMPIRPELSFRCSFWSTPFTFPCAIPLLLYATINAHVRRSLDNLPILQLRWLWRESRAHYLLKFSTSASLSRLFFPVSTDVEFDSRGICVVSPQFRSLHLSVYFRVYFPKEKKLN